MSARYPEQVAKDWQEQMPGAAIQSPYVPALDDLVAPVSHMTDTVYKTMQQTALELAELDALLGQTRTRLFGPWPQNSQTDQVKVNPPGSLHELMEMALALRGHAQHLRDFARFLHEI